MNFWRSRFFLSPADVNFTQDSVAICFQNEYEINKACEEIAKENLSATEFPNIRVLFEDGEYFSVDNRRLYVFRVLNILGLLNWIHVRKVNKFDRERTTKNNGCHVFVRNRKVGNRWVRPETYRHCSCFEGRKKRFPSWWNNKLKCHLSLVNIQLQRPVLGSSSSRKQSANEEELPSGTWPVKAVMISSISSSITNLTNNKKNDVSESNYQNASQTHLFHFSNHTPTFAAPSSGSSEASQPSADISVKCRHISNISSNFAVEPFNFTIGRNSVSTSSKTCSLDSLESNYQEISNQTAQEEHSYLPTLSITDTKDNDAEASTNFFSCETRSDPSSFYISPVSTTKDPNLETRKRLSSTVFQSDLLDLHDPSNPENLIQSVNSEKHTSPHPFRNFQENSCAEVSTASPFPNSCTSYSRPSNVGWSAATILSDTFPVNMPEESSTTICRSSILTSIEEEKEEKEKDSTIVSRSDWLEFFARFDEHSLPCKDTSALTTDYNSPSMYASLNPSPSIAPETNCLDFGYPNNSKPLNRVTNIEEHNSPNKSFTLPTANFSYTNEVRNCSVSSLSTVSETDLMDFYTPGIPNTSNPFADVEELNFPNPIHNTEIFPARIQQPHHQQLQVRSSHDEIAISSQDCVDWCEGCIKRLFCCCF